MHALHLPPRHMWRATILAALAALATFAIFNPPDLGGGGATASSSVQVRPAAPDAHPSWLEHPLAPPTLRLQH